MLSGRSPFVCPPCSFRAESARTISIEPIPAMILYLEREAARLDMKLDTAEGAGGHLGVSCVNAVVTMLVSCSVCDQTATL